MERQKLTPRTIARLWGISPDKVLAWIRSGELRAMNAATKVTGRPRYLVDLKDLVAFEQARATRSTAKPVRRKRMTGIVEFF